MEKKAIETEEQARIDAQRERRAVRTGQGSLAVDVPRSVEALRASEIEQARVWMEHELAKAAWITYSNLMPGVLERFSVTETEFKDLLVAAQKLGQITFTGMTAGQRRPREGTIIRRNPST